MLFTEFIYIATEVTVPGVKSAVDISNKFVKSDILVVRCVSADKQEIQDIVQLWGKYFQPGRDFIFWHSYPDSWKLTVYPQLAQAKAVTRQAP